MKLIERHYLDLDGRKHQTKKSCLIADKRFKLKAKEMLSIEIAKWTRARGEYDGL